MQTRNIKYIDWKLTESVSRSEREKILDNREVRSGTNNNILTSLY